MLFSDLIKDSDFSHKIRSQKDVIRHIETRIEESANYSIFLGAGASVTSGIRSANELINGWALELAERYSERTPENSADAISYLEKNQSAWYNMLNPYSSLFEKKYEFASQRRRFVEQEVDNKSPSIGYAFLISLIKEKFINTIFTTNFDDLINEAFYQFSDIRPLACAHDSSINAIPITAKRPKIIKIHGDYLFEDIKSTIKETESLEQNTKKKLMQFCTEFGLIVIGYSGNDRSVMDVLEFLTKQESCLKNGIYWCLRENDSISPALRNFLWKEKVYPVKIDGFDQFFAEAHNAIIKTPLDIKSNKKDSRIQKVIDSIVSDKFGLTKNEIIRAEINQINRDTSSHDISKFINEISQNNGSGTPLNLSDMRNLLEVDTFVKNGKIKEAYELCLEYFNKSIDDEDIKINYISKLLDLSRRMDNMSQALIWSSRLVEIDRFNINYKIAYAKCLESNVNRYEYIKNLFSDHKYSWKIYNFAAETAIEIIRAEPNTKTTSYKEILELLSKSMKADSSLDNSAIKIKQRALIDQLSSTTPLDENKNAKKELSEILEYCQKCNPEHINTLNTLVIHAIHVVNEFSYAKSVMDDLSAVEKKSSKSIKSKILLLQNKLAHSYRTLNENKGFKIELEKFYESVVKDQNIKNDSQILLDKAGYFIGQKNQMSAAEDYFNMAIDSDDIDDNFEKLLTIASYLKKELVEKAYKKIKAMQSSIDKASYLNLTSEYYVLVENYDKAADEIDKAYNQGLPLRTYLAKYTFILIKQKKYQKVIELVNAYEMNINGEHMETVLINYQFAAKELKSEKFDEVKVRNLSAQSKQVSVRLCAFILNNQLADAKRILKSEIENDYTNFYDFKSWPIIPEKLLEEVNSEQKAAAA